MKKILLLASFLAVGGIAIAQKSYNLQFKPKQGDKYDAVTSTKATVTQSLMGQDMVMVMDYNVDMLYDIGKADNNTALNLTYNKLSMKMDAMGQKMEMSSDDPDETNSASKPFKSLKGAKLSVLVSPNGEVVDVTGADDLVNRLGEASQMEKETVKAFIGKDNIKSTMEQSMKIFPGKPVKVGDTWTVTLAVESPYKLTSNNTYKLIKVENGTAFLDVAGTVSTGGAQKMTSGGMEMTVDLSGDQKGSLQVDEATGVTKNVELKQNLKGKMEVMGQQVPMTVISDTKVVMTKK